MKQLYVLLITILLAFSSFPQTIDHIEFDYDDAGNRETREVIYFKTAEMEDTLATNQNTFGLVTDAMKYKGIPGSLEVMKTFAL